MQKQLNTSEFGPGADSAKLTGNKQAQVMADKAKQALSASEADALLLAQRNEVLDNAIERLGRNAEHWVSGRLAREANGSRIRYESGTDDITQAAAQLFREKGVSFCLVGALGAEYGPHSHEAVDQAISAVNNVVRPGIKFRESYGFTNGNVWEWNDAQLDGRNVINAIRLAKSQPLRRD